MCSTRVSDISFFFLFLKKFFIINIVLIGYDFILISGFVSANIPLELYIVCVCVSTHVSICVYMYVDVSVYIYLCIYEYLCIRTYVCECTYICIINMNLD